MPHYTQEQIERANSTELVDFLRTHGEKLKMKGSQYLWEKHQAWICGNRWYSHYHAVGRSAISFAMRYFALGFQDAIAELLRNASSLLPPKQKELIIPERSETMDQVCVYLTQKRFIDREVISFFVQNKTLYEDAQYHKASLAMQISI